MLHIFPTSRKLREFYGSFSEDTLLPYTLSIGEFEAKAVYVPDRVEVDEDKRVLLLKQACDFEHFKAFHIPEEFLSFLTNSSYIFRFFEELTSEKKSIDDLRGADVYGEFDEHLDILEEVFERYLVLLEKEGFYDKITLPLLYKLNSSYLDRFSNIAFHLEGFLNAYEWELFELISKSVNVDIYLHTNAYNKKVQSLFWGLELPQDAYLKINLNTKSFTVVHQDQNKANVVSKSFSVRSLQIGYVHEKIKEFIERGIKPENIAVVLPDESFALLLRAYDASHNLNFAMGTPFSQSLAYQRLYAINEYIKEKNQLNVNSIERYELEDVVMSFEQKWHQDVSYEEFAQLLDLVGLELNFQEKKLYEHSLYKLKNLFKLTKLSLSQAYKLFLQKLSKLVLDDVKGGRVVVLGLLETRGLEFEGLIIVDFNDEFVPRFVSKDMFLSSRLRAYAKLPSLRDRENLQRYFYHSIISRAKEVAISYTENENALKSRFLQDIAPQKDERYEEKSYMSLLFTPQKQLKPFYQEDLMRENELFKKPLSSSRLKLFLECKRGYFHSYIQGIEDKGLPSDELGANDIGNFLHLALQKLYQTKTSFSSAQELYKALKQTLDAISHPNPQWLLEKEIWLKKLFSFCENEMRHFEQGWKPFELEKILRCEFEGIVIEGKIDRIDVNEQGEYCVLDYKSGKIKLEQDLDKMSDFQLQFYHLLCSNAYKNVLKVGYYDLNSSKIIYEDMMEQKLGKLRCIINELKAQKSINFALGEKDCIFSPYEILLGRYDG